MNPFVDSFIHSFIHSFINLLQDDEENGCLDFPIDDDDDGGRQGKAALTAVAKATAESNVEGLLRLAKTVGKRRLARYRNKGDGTALLHVAAREGAFMSVSALVRLIGCDPSAVSRFINCIAGRQAGSTESSN